MDMDMDMCLSPQDKNGDHDQQDMDMMHGLHGRNSIVVFPCQLCSTKCSGTFRSVYQLYQ
jgi:hypothetical protein